MGRRLIYRSSSDDTWHLVREAGTGRLFVKHTPNAASGGHATHIELGDFLSRNPYSAEHIALLTLIGTLLDHADDQRELPLKDAHPAFVEG